MAGNILTEIVTHKRREVAETMARVPLADVQRRAPQAQPPRDFRRAVTCASPAGMHVIAEIKRRSPSAGLIRSDFDPVAIARTYVAGGASALSVLTDEKFFDGRLEYLSAVRAAVHLPVLRKDFVIDAYQVWEARAAGADAVLLITEVLGVELAVEYAALIGQLGMTALIEAYAPDLLAGVVGTWPRGVPRHVLIGINNRDLAAQRTDLATTERLAALVPDASMLVSESGIRTRDDVLRVQRAGARAVLVGETLMAAEDPAAALRMLLGA
jgi:indole-3-glycerol phosphate synthase